MSDDDEDFSVGSDVPSDDEEFIKKPKLIISEEDEKSVPDEDLNEKGEDVDYDTEDDVAESEGEEGDEGEEADEGEEVLGDEDVGEDVVEDVVESADESADENEDENADDNDSDEQKTLHGGAKKKQTVKTDLINNVNDDSDEDDDDDDSYLQKFSAEVNKNYLVDFHPECSVNNYDEIATLSLVTRDKNNNIIDDLHKTIPYLTKYEKSRIIGQRAKQINSGAKTFVKVPENIIDGYLIAEMELLQKRIPFIIRRPIFGGGCEYWRVQDLENVGF